MSSCNCAKCQVRNAPFVLNGATFNGVPTEEQDLLDVPTINWAEGSTYVTNAKKQPPPFARGGDEDEEDGVTENSETDDLLPLPTMSW